MKLQSNLNCWHTDLPNPLNGRNIKFSYISQLKKYVPNLNPIITYYQEELLYKERRNMGNHLEISNNHTSFVLGYTWFRGRNFF